MKNASSIPAAKIIDGGLMLQNTSLELAHDWATKLNGGVLPKFNHFGGKDHGLVEYFVPAHGGQIKSFMAWLGERPAYLN